MKYMFAFFLFVGLAMLSHAQSTVSTAAQVKEVVLFTQGAEVTNQIQANLPKGTVKLVVMNVASDIDERTIQLSGPSDVTVLSVSRENTQDEITLNATHKTLKDSLKMLSEQHETLTNKKTAAEGALRILNNENLLGGEGKIDYNALSGLVNYYQEKAVQLNADISQYQKQLTALDKKIAKLNEQLKSYIGGSQIAIQLVAAKAGAINSILSYRTNSAHWQPFYDIRATSISSPVQFLYKANIVQYSGVDWRNVKLTLSSGNPSLSGDAPVLQPSYLREDIPTSNVPGMLQGRVAGVAVTSRAKMEAADEVVDMKETAGPQTIIQQNQLSATFEIDVPYDILSNGQPHSVTLNTFEHAGLFKYYAVPKMDKDAFLLAEITDYESLNLMPGEANVFFENQYVGKSQINTNITTDTLNLSFGRDKAIQIKRERIMDQKSTQVSGGSKRTSYTYEIRVRNTKSSTVNMVLLDQIPISSQKDVEVSLLDDGGATINREKGELEWKISVEPSKTNTYRFTYQVKQPRDKNISHF